MSLSYEQNKISIYNWNERNKEKNRAINYLAVRAYRERKKALQKICEEFRKILIDDVL